MSVATVTTNRMDHERARTAEGVGTPLYYYSLKTLRGQVAKLRDAMSGYPVQLMFATMANDRPEILRSILAENVGACVNSIPHLQKALDHGFSLNNIQFTSCGLPVSDMDLLQSLGVPTNLDSPSQIQAWCKLKEGTLVGARMNAASLAGSPAQPDRIGMDFTDFERAREIARQLNGRVNGVHVYAGTNFQSSEQILPILRSAFELVRRFKDLDYLNIGGGIGIDYSHSGDGFEYYEFGDDVCSLARQVSEERETPLRVLFEPGRCMVGSSAEFITRVTDVKTLGNTRFVVVDASVSVFPRPYHNPGNYHKVRVLDVPDCDIEKTTRATVVGRTTFSRDILGSYDLPENLSVGALLAFEDAGAYCESMMSRFLGQREPMYYVSED
jgi:diaminopimelate decarboxylase